VIYYTPATLLIMSITTQGFDLDDAQGNVVLEMGGGATPEVTAADQQQQQEEGPPTAEDYKQQGNAAFTSQNWELALEYYTKAIDATPGMKADELIALRAAWQEERHLEMRKKMNEEEEQRRKRKENKEEQVEEKKEKEPPPVFQPPPHPHGEKLAVYHCNRAAVYLHLQRYDQVVDDCDVAILWNPMYAKAYIRRCTAYEQIDKTDMALEDAKAALKMDPGNKKILQTVRRLQKLEDERLETLKAETLDKLKGLGNTILGGFGLSLDNFNAVQDPNTGSYSINFQQ
jgi:tetratricopeptide (TPR) repeat protein